MWMGVPIVTRQGNCFASRVCSSLVRAAGLPELACETTEEFVGKAIALAQDPTERNRLRTVLLERQGILFDTPRLVRALEGLYQRMWNDFIRGERPRPSLANMAVYNDVAIDLALRSAETGNDLETYRRALAGRQNYTYLEADHRLSQSTDLSQSNETSDSSIATQAISC
jgi:hypothetical protein